MTPPDVLDASISGAGEIDTLAPSFSFYESTEFRQWDDSN
jgi:hypothetical protein